MRTLISSFASRSVTSLFSTILLDHAEEAALSREVIEATLASTGTPVEVCSACPAKLRSRDGRGRRRNCDRAGTRSPSRRGRRPRNLPYRKTRGEAYYLIIATWRPFALASSLRCLGGAPQALSERRPDTFNQRQERLKRRFKCWRYLDAMVISFMEWSSPD
jgi:hypothetical protein